MAGHSPSDDNDTDWRRLASDRNVSHGVARVLWEQAKAAAPHDPAQAEHAFHVMLDEAEAANITHEPGRETLANSTPSARDASALGPGKWTRVLLEQGKPGGQVAAAPPGAEAAKSSGERLRDELAAAGQASKNAAEMLAASDPATIVAALRELGGAQGAGVVQKVMSMAGGVIERMLSQRPAQPGSTAAGGASPPQAQPSSAAPASQTESNTTVPASQTKPDSAGPTTQAKSSANAPASQPSAAASGRAAPAPSAGSRAPQSSLDRARAGSPDRKR